MLALAPVVPLGTHSVLGTVSQHKVLTAIRACEVAADPTNALALEASARRRALGRAQPVKLAGYSRWYGRSGSRTRTPRPISPCSGW